MEHNYCEITLNLDIWTSVDKLDITLLYELFITSTNSGNALAHLLTSY